MTDPCLNTDRLIKGGELKTLCELKKAAAQESMTFKKVLDEALKKASTSTSHYVVEAVAVPAGKTSCRPCTAGQTETVQQLKKNLNVVKSKATKQVENLKRTLKDGVKTVHAKVDAATHAAHDAISATTAQAHSATASASQQVKDVADKVGTALGTKSAAVSSSATITAQHVNGDITTVPMAFPSTTAKPLAASAPTASSALAMKKGDDGLMADIKRGIAAITGKSGGRRSRRRRRQRNKRTRRKKRRKKHKKTRHRRKRRRHCCTKRY